MISVTIQTTKTINSKVLQIIFDVQRGKDYMKLPKYLFSIVDLPVLVTITGENITYI